MHNRAPEYLTEEINLIRDGNNSSLRDSMYNLVLQPIYNLALQNPRTEILEKSFSYRGAKLWNSLPNELKMKSEESPQSFQKRLFTLGL